MGIATISDIESILQIVFTNPSDPRVQANLDIAQALMEHEAGFPFDQPASDITVQLDGTGTRDLWVTRKPIASLTSVTENGSALTVDDDFVWTKAGKLSKLNGALWVDEYAAVEVVYLPGWADETDAPQGLRRAVANAAARFWQQGYSWADTEGALSLIKQETIGSYSVTYRDGGIAGYQFELLPGEVAIARRYRTKTGSKRT